MANVAAHSTSGADGAREAHCWITQFSDLRSIFVLRVLAGSANALSPYGTSFRRDWPNGRFNRSPQNPCDSPAGGALSERDLPPVAEAGPQKSKPCSVFAVIP